MVGLVEVSPTADGVAEGPHDHEDQADDEHDHANRPEDGDTNDKSDDEKDYAEDDHGQSCLRGESVE